LEKHTLLLNHAQNISALRPSASTSARKYRLRNSA